MGKCVIKSEALHDAVRELAEQPGATVVQFTMGQDVSCCQSVSSTTTAAGWQSPFS